MAVWPPKYPIPPQGPTSLVDFRSKICSAIKPTPIVSKMACLHRFARLTTQIAYPILRAHTRSLHSIPGQLDRFLAKNTLVFRTHLKKSWVIAYRFDPKMARSRRFARLTTQIAYPDPRAHTRMLPSLLGAGRSIFGQKHAQPPSPPR